MGDDGIGIYILEKLREKHPEWEFLELNTPGYSLLSYLEGKDSLILIDAADFGGNPGEIKRARKEEIRSVKKSSSCDLHGADILMVLDNAFSWGISTQEIILYCIQIESIVPMSPLSPSVEGAARQVISSVEKDMEHLRLF